MNLILENQKYEAQKNYILVVFLIAKDKEFCRKTEEGTDDDKRYPLCGKGLECVVAGGDYGMCEKGMLGTS